MKKPKWLLTIFAMLAATSAQAGILSTTNVNVISPPTSVQKNDLVGTPASLMLEKSQHTTSTDLTVDITSDGTYNADPGNTTFSSGQVVDSYYLHFDILSVSATSTSGSITFDTNILAIIAQDDHLSNSHAELGNAGTTYWTGVNSLHGIWDSAVDTVTLNGNSLDFAFQVGTAIDSIRILVEIPEPTGLILCGIGMISLVAYRRRNIR